MTRAAHIEEAPRHNPYAPSRAAAGADRPAWAITPEDVSAPLGQFQPLLWRATWAQVGIGVAGACALIVAVVDALVLGGVTGPATSPTLIADAHATATAGQMVGLILGGIFIAIAFHRAHLNAAALGAQGMRFSAGWAAGAWFVPILSWWWPYVAASEIWRASDPAWRGGSTWQQQTARPAFLPWWWATFLVATVGLGSVAEAVLDKADPLTPRILLGLELAQAAFLVAAAIMALKLVSGIEMRQIERYRRLSAGAGTAYGEISAR